jgi:2-polyprenyl-3-methyl-5-hydroxy-6-metoxy-1,4-benzoquinol methylase
MTCLLCGSADQQIFARVESFGFPLVYYACGRCGLVSQSQEESQAADPEFYAKTYRKIYQASEEPTPKDLWVQSQRAAHLIGVVRSAGVSQLNSMLDIGASAGVLLESFREAFDCRVTGVEPGESYRVVAESKGIRMVPRLEDLLDSNPARFDLVSLSHVLEHLPDPVGTLRTIREQLLTEDGLLLIEVPNFYAHDSYELAHLACYTPHTLQEVVRQSGFEIIALKRHGVPRSAILNLYLTVLAKPANDSVESRIIKPERNVALKRKIGMLYRRLIQKLFPHRAWLSLPDGKGS